MIYLNFDELLINFRIQVLLKYESTWQSADLKLSEGVLFMCLVTCIKWYFLSIDLVIFTLVDWNYSSGSFKFASLVLALLQHNGITMEQVLIKLLRTMIKPHHYVLIKILRAKRFFRLLSTFYFHLSFACLSPDKPSGSKVKVCSVNLLSHFIHPNIG